MARQAASSWKVCLVFVLDVDRETSLEAVKGFTRMDILKHGINLLASAKKRVDSRHTFALAVLSEKARLVAAPTSSLDSFAAAVARVQSSSTSFSSVELGSLDTVAADVLQAAELSTAQAQVRIILLCCRSNVVPRWQVNKGAAVALDVLYIHERPMPGINCPQEAFNALEEICDNMAKAARHHAYIFECGAGNVKKWLNVMMWLLAHPQQRLPQQALGSLAPVDIATSTASVPHMGLPSAPALLLPGEHEGIPGSTPAQNVMVDIVVPDMLH